MIALSPHYEQGRVTIAVDRPALPEGADHELILSADFHRTSKGTVRRIIQISIVYLVAHTALSSVGLSLTFGARMSQ